MKLKLPEPLSYDVVDQMIDETWTFRVDEWEDTDHNTNETTRFTQWVCRPKIGAISNWGRDLFELVTDVPDDNEEDEDGYVDWPYSHGMVWTTRAWTEEELDDWVKSASGDV